MAAYERVTLNRGGRNSRFDCIFCQKNKYLARYLLLKMRPRTGERTVAYAIRLREQPVECEFGDNYEERILEQLIMTVKNE